MFTFIAEVWDGTRYRGPARLSWATRGSDGIITELEPVPVEGPAFLERDVRPEFSIIPGLIDTHVHLIGYAGSETPDFLTWPLITRPEEQVLHGLNHARRALESGVTTLRDLSADEGQFSLRRAIDDGIVVGPRLQAHGMVSMTAGHGDLFIPPAFALRKPTADGPDECRKLVRHWARAGADGIKIATSGGVLSVGDKNEWRNHTRAEIAAIVDETHALGMRVAAHAHTPDGIEIALAEGVDSIEHGTLMTAEQAKVMADTGIPVAPTLLINDLIASGGGGVTAEQTAKALELTSQRDALLADAADRGVNFVLGTDANGRHVQFGDQLAEVRRMVEILKFSPSQALASATSAAAAAIGRPDLGNLAPGHKADFVIMKGRPWASIADLDRANIQAVISRGRVVAGALPEPVEGS